MPSLVWFLFLGITVAAAVVDLSVYRIPNLVVLALLVLFAIVAAVHWREVPWLSHLGAFMLVLGAGIVAHAFGQMGAGDAKLLAALALWAGLYSLIALLFWVSVCALAAMLVIIALRFMLPAFANAYTLPRVLRKKEGIPFAIGMGPGALIAALSFEPWLWR